MRASLRSLLLLAACGVVALVLSDYLTSDDTTPVVVPDVLPVLPDDFGAQAQGWQWTQSTGNSTRIEARAEGLVQRTNGQRTDLRNAELTIFHEDSGGYDRIESAEMRLVDGGDLFSEGETVMTLGIVEGGSARPAVITTTEVTFLADENRARTDRPVHYDFEDWEGTSVGAVFDAGSGEVRMLSDVRLERRGAPGAGGRATIEAGSLRYSEHGARIDLVGGAMVRQGRRSIRCEEASLGLVDGRIERIDGIRASGLDVNPGQTSSFGARRLRVDFGVEGELRRVRGQGGARFASDDVGQHIGVSGRLVDLQYGPAPLTGRSRLRSVDASGAALVTLEMKGSRTRSTLTSERLRLSLYPDSARIESVEALERGVLEHSPDPLDVPARVLKGDRIGLQYGRRGILEAVVATGDARLLQLDGGSGVPVLRTASDRLRAALDPESASVAEVVQSGAFRFEEMSDAGQSLRRGGAERGRFDLEASLITLEGTATVSDGTSEVSARRIVVNREDGRLEARGAATASVAPQNPADGERAPGGILSGRQAVYASADSIVSVPDDGSLECRGSARIWQGATRVDADAIVLDSDSSGLRASGSILATWAEGPMEDDLPGDRPTGFATVEAKRMSFSEESGEAVFLYGVDFRHSGMRVLSDQLRTRPGAGQDPGRAVATGTVRIAQSGHLAARGFADRADFRLASSEVELTGAPARLIGPDGTETRGASLTLRESDNSVLVLGQGGERTYTYHLTAR